MKRRVLLRVVAAGVKTRLLFRGVDDGILSARWVFRFALVWTSVPVLLWISIWSWNVSIGDRCVGLHAAAGYAGILSKLLIGLSAIAQVV